MKRIWQCLIWHQDLERYYKSCHENLGKAEGQADFKYQNKGTSLFPGKGLSSLKNWSKTTFKWDSECIDHLGDRAQEDSHGSCPHALQSGQNPLNHQLISASMHEMWSRPKIFLVVGKTCLSYRLMEIPWLKATISGAWHSLLDNNLFSAYCATWRCWGWKGEVTFPWKNNSITGTWLGSKKVWATSNLKSPG